MEESRERYDSVEISYSVADDTKSRAEAYEDYLGVTLIRSGDTVIIE